jgi:cyclophilin family peptidyl-prolyl cis-trans isomerase
MKLSSCCILVAALLTAPVAPAQTAASLLTPKAASAKKAEDAKTAPQTQEAKAAAAAKATADKAAARAAANEVHTLAVMEVEFSGGTHEIIFELYTDKAPKTVANFIDNVDKGIYSGMAFHRAVDDYLVQTGDPLSKDNEAREKWGLSQEYTIPGEFKLPHVSGSVAMARRGDKVNPDRKSDGTQFYFALGNMSALNGQYSVFGQVIGGLDDLRQLSKVVTDSNDCPLERVEIKKIRVVEQKGPLVTVNSTGKDKGKSRVTRPQALKGPVEKFLDRVW